MFFNRNVANTRRAEVGDGSLPPRFARLVREAWWLLVVALLIYLALILASYTNTDPGWSFSGTGAPLGNRGGPVARGWRTSCCTFSGCRHGGGWSAAPCWPSPDFASSSGPTSTPTIRCCSGAIGFALVLLSSAALESIRLWKLTATLPLAPGGAFGDALGQGAAPRPWLQRGDAAPAGAARRRPVAAVRHLVAQGDGAHRCRHRGTGCCVAPPA